MIASSARFLEWCPEWLRNRLEIADRSLDGSLADSSSVQEVTEHCQGQSEFIAEQVTDLLNVVEILC